MDVRKLSRAGMVAWTALAGALLVGCADDRLLPEFAPSATERRPVLLSDGRYDRVNVTNYASLVTNGDWTAAIQAAANESHEVFFPIGTYDLKSAPQSARIGCSSALTNCGHIHAAVRLPNGTRMIGTGTGSVIRQTFANAGVFIAGNEDYGSATDITVDSLTMEGVEPSPAGGPSTRSYALWTRRGSNVTVRQNRVSNMGVFSNDHVLEFTDSASYNSVPYPTLPSSNIEVIGNTGVGRSSRQGWSATEAIVVGWADGVTISGNNVQHYISGIQWWGGNSRLMSTATAARKMRNVTVRDNYAGWVGLGGIWGTMADSVLVENNTAEECWDVCFDSEGDANARYQFNTGRNAGNGVASAFDHTPNLVFYWNSFYQDGQQRVDASGARSGPVNRQLFATSTKYDATQIAILNTRFEYTGNDGKVGSITKSESTSFAFAANEIKNVILAMDVNHNGAMSVINNTFTFDRPTLYGTQYLPAIRVGNNYGPGGSITGINGGWEVEIGNNSVSSSVPQQTAGIVVAEVNPYVGNQIDHWIYLNRVRNFPAGIVVDRVQKTNGNYDYFFIDDNLTTGSRPTNATNLEVTADNATLDPEPHRVGYKIRRLGSSAWSDERFGNETAGEISGGSEIDGFQVRVMNMPGVGVCYAANIVGQGWQTEQCNGSVAGVAGVKTRALRIRLTNAPAGTSICYRVVLGEPGWHSGTSWQSEVCANATAGATIGTDGVRAVRIRIVG